MKTQPKKKRKLPQKNPETDNLEKEMNEIIDREKTKSKIVSKLFNQPITSRPE